MATIKLLAEINKNVIKLMLTKIINIVYNNKISIICKNTGKEVKGNGTFGDTDTGCLRGCRFISGGVYLVFVHRRGMCNF
jgi:hypothetical protein